MYTIEYEINPKLPKLAWLADINRNNGRIVVYAGSYVECHDSFFSAGAWSGDFISAGFDSSDVSYGTGAKLDAEGIHFYTPSHALERIVGYEDEKRIIFCNSVPMIMSYTDMELDPSIDQYERYFCSILHGPQKCCNAIPMREGKYLYQYIVGSVTVDAEGKITYKRRAAVEPFKNFDDYYGRMMDDMRAVYANATSPDRKNTKYGLCTTISSGYDSIANAAVARQLGCNRAVSLSGSIFDEDDGAVAAREMGYTNIIKRDHLSYREKKGCVDAEYISSGEIAKHQQFCVFEDQFADCLVFMGTRGDYFWGLNSEANNDFDMVGFFYNETDISFTENALRNGYIFVAMATYGTSQSTTIQPISKSEEMKPWRLGTEYDRPIPRRIAESVGAKRDSFGQSKRGGGFSFCYDTTKTLSRKMSFEGYSCFVEYCKTHKPVNKLSKYIHAVQFWSSFLPSYINFVFKKLHIKIHLKQKAMKVANPFVSSRLIFWSVDLMKKRYGDVLGK
ncbi:MAG: hypothetical protein IJB57_00760 [Clostridia bacterium]|nr:hypothetical protein [Clostridia bacterium]